VCVPRTAHARRWLAFNGIWNHFFLTCLQTTDRGVNKKKTETEIFRSSFSLSAKKLTQTLETYDFAVFYQKIRNVRAIERNSIEESFIRSAKFVGETTP
jgi:hypothetical protein